MTEVSERENLLKISEILLKTATAMEEMLQQSCFVELDQTFGTVLEKLNTFFKRIEESLKDFVVFERYVTCAYTKELDFGLLNIPEDVKEKVWKLRENMEICGFTGRECLCKKSMGYLERRFIDEVKALGSIGETVRSDSSDLIKGMETLSQKVNVLTESAKKIMDIAEAIEMIALNAYIEAARLGEHGRGFKVIADEVRRASTKTNELASEIIESIKTFQESFTDQINKQIAFDEKVESLNKDQQAFSEDLQKDLLWMTRNFIDFITYMRKFVDEDIKLLGEVREVILNALQVIDLTNQKTVNTHKALVILAQMVDEFEKVLREEKELDVAYDRVAELYEEFKRIPKLMDEREVIARAEGEQIDRSQDVVGEKLEDTETDIELF